MIFLKDFMNQSPSSIENKGWELDFLSIDHTTFLDQIRLTAIVVFWSFLKLWRNK